MLENLDVRAAVNAVLRDLGIEPPPEVEVLPNKSVQRLAAAAEELYSRCPTRHREAATNSDGVARSTATEHLYGLAELTLIVSRMALDRPDIAVYFLDLLDESQKRIVSSHADVLISYLGRSSD